MVEKRASAPGSVAEAELGALEVATACGLALLIGARVGLPYGFELGPVLALMLIPAWLGILRSYRGGVLVLALMSVAVLSGVLLTELNTPAHPLLRDALVSRSAIVVGLAGAVGGLLWCREAIGAKRMALLFGIGMMLGIPLNVSPDPNQWRFTYSLPIIVFTLALTSLGRTRLGLQVAACFALGIIGLLNDSRSNSAMLLLAAAVVLWQAIDHGMRRGRGGSVMLVVWAVTIYVFLRSSILGGAFGEVTMARTQEQITRGGGSLLLGGRPEIAASAELIHRHPLGLGSGIGVTYDDLMAAKAGMTNIGYDPDNGYVERFMFGNGVEVHSTLGDYWLWFGLPGLACLMVLVWVVIRGVQREYDIKALTVLTAYLATRFLWDLGFSPAASGASLGGLCIAMFLARLGARDPRDRESSGSDLALTATTGPVREPGRLLKQV